MEQVFQERFQAAGAFDALFHLFDFAIRQILPASANWSVVAQAAQKEFNLAQSKAHVTGKADQQYAVQ